MRTAAPAGSRLNSFSRTEKVAAGALGVGSIGTVAAIGGLVAEYPFHVAAQQLPGIVTAGTELQVAGIGTAMTLMWTRRPPSKGNPVAINDKRIRATLVGSAFALALANYTVPTLPLPIKVAGVGCMAAGILGGL